MATQLSERQGARAPSGSDTLLRRVSFPALVAAPVVAATVYVANVDPGTPGHYPGCPFLAVTGYFCPGCGGLRAIHALTHGHPLQALHDNAYGLAVVAALAVWWAAWLVARVRGRALSTRPVRVVMFTALALMPLFTVLRNLPFGHFLAP